MQTFNRQTRTLYYDDMYLCSARAKIVEIGPNYIELDATVAFPEGGGQEADTGVIVGEDGTTIRFIGAQKVFGRMLFLKDFPNILVEGVIRHIVSTEDSECLKGFACGTYVDVHIDIDRRAQLSLSHTASHLLYVGIATVRPDAVLWTRGCHIKPNGARFDFSVANKFSQDETNEIARIANEMVRRKNAIRLFQNDLEPFARYWECEGHVIPCGGTHIETTAPVGSLVVKRKGLGKGRERLTCEFPEASIFKERFHR